ncbi:MAG: NfeD family protein [Actinobacteria bacterium]|nr:NfeD family protein [Actinomycetota bacterium]
MADRERVVEEVVHYWTEAGLARTVVAEMRAELEQHLAEAESDGRPPSQVVGDRARFAEAWAEARAGHRMAAWEDVQSGKTRKDRQTRRDTALYGLGVVALVAAAAVAGQGDTGMDNEVWRWLWTIFAVVMGVGEMFTAGFFLLPFAIGAAVAAVLAWLEVALVAQWLVFFGVSAFSFAYLRRYISRQDEGAQPQVGANRWIGTEGVVLDPIDPTTGSGLVRVLNEQWRAVAPQRLETGTRVMVTDVRGTRLVVERLET